MSSPHSELDAFLTNNSDLLRLEGMLSRFNLFEAVGVVRQELRHSDFLAFLIDPNQSHGLKSTFLRELLLATNVTQSVTFAGFDLTQATVFREWHHVDILVVDDVNRLAVIIENKIGTGEHSDQLNRYQNDFARHYPGYEFCALYLTPEGDKPSSNGYHAISYKLVCNVVDQIAQDNRNILNRELTLALEHYVQMLRRHILTDSDVAQLCRSIYHKHRQALDLIFEHRPDQQTQIGNFVSSLIQQDERFYAGGRAKNWVTFGMNEWKKSPRLEGGLFYVYFEFHNRPSDLKILCSVSPGDTEDRGKLLHMAHRHQFTGCQSKLNKGYYRAAIISVLHAGDYEKSQEEIEDIILEKWTTFLCDELPHMAQAIREEEWLWVLPGNAV